MTNNRVGVIHYVKSSLGGTYRRLSKRGPFARVRVDDQKNLGTWGGGGRTMKRNKNIKKRKQKTELGERILNYFSLTLIHRTLVTFPLLPSQSEFECQGAGTLSLLRETDLKVRDK